MSNETTDPIAAIVREAMDYAAGHGRITTPEDYADRIREALATLAAGEDVRERVVWLLSQWVDELEMHWEDPEDDMEPAGVGQIADRILSLLRTPRGEGDGDALGMLQASVDEYLWEAQNNPQFDAEAAFAALSREIRAALRSEAQGGGDVGEVCDLCGEEFDPSESGTVTGPLGQDDGVPRWYRCPRCARAYDAGYQQGQRDPRGDEAADPTAPRSEAQEEDTIPVSALRSEIALLRAHRLLPYLAWARLCALAGGVPVGEDTRTARRGEGGGDG